MEFLLKSRRFLKYMILAGLAIPAAGVVLIGGGGGGDKPQPPESQLSQGPISQFATFQDDGTVIAEVCSSGERWEYHPDAPQFAKVKLLLKAKDPSIVLWAAPTSEVKEIYVVEAGGRKVVTYAESVRYHQNAGSFVFLGIVVLIVGIAYDLMLAYTLIYRRDLL